MGSPSQLLWAEILRIEGYDRVPMKWWWFGLPIIALMVLLASWRMTVQLVQWWLQPRLDPNGLFRQLARLHGLNTKERSLLSELGSTLPSAAPIAVLFADPSSWAWKKVPDQKGIQPLEELYLKIFGFPRDQEGN